MPLLMHFFIEWFHITAIVDTAIGKWDLMFTDMSLSVRVGRPRLIV